MHEFHNICLFLQSGLSEMGNLLSEEQFSHQNHDRHGDNNDDDNDDDGVSPQMHEDQHFAFSPDDPTLQNIENLDLDLSPRRDQFASPGNQLPSENLNIRQLDDGDAERSGFAQLSGNSSPVSDGIRTPVNQNQPTDVQQILHELSITDQEDNNGLSEPMSLPQLPSEQNHHSNTLSIQHTKAPVSETDILPSRYQSRNDQSGYASGDDSGANDHDVHVEHKHRKSARHRRSHSWNDGQQENKQVIF